MLHYITDRPTDMTNGDEFSDEFIENFLENCFELWFDEELEDKGLSRGDFRKGQVFLKSPFAIAQFEE